MQRGQGDHARQAGCRQAIPVRLHAVHPGHSVSCAWPASLAYVVRRTQRATGLFHERWPQAGCCALHAAGRKAAFPEMQEAGMDLRSWPAWPGNRDCGDGGAGPWSVPPWQKGESFPPGDRGCGVAMGRGGHPVAGRSCRAGLCHSAFRRRGVSGGRLPRPCGWRACGVRWP